MVVLILKTWVSVLANYVDYFPPNFEADFLVGRREHFRDLYPIAFYAHILSTPYVLIAGLVLLNDSFRRRYRKGHRILGRVQAALVLVFVVPSGMVMSQYSLAGPISNYGFLISSILTGVCVAMGWRYAVRRQFDRHRRWMLRCYVLLCSAVSLRVIGGIVSVTGIEPLQSYRWTAWASWIVPGLVLEGIIWWRSQAQSQSIYPPNTPGST